MSRSLATNCGALDSLKVRTRCGRSLCARQIRSTELGLIPTAAAMAAAVQWVASCGGSVAVSATTRSIAACARGGMREGRVLSRSSPATPSAANRSCQRRTHRLLLPAPRLIAAGASPAPPPAGAPPRPRRAPPFPLAGRARDRGGAGPPRRDQDDPRPPDVLLRAVPVRHDRFQTGTVLGGQLDLDPFAHPRHVGMAAVEGTLC